MGAGHWGPLTRLVSTALGSCTRLEGQGGVSDGHDGWEVDDGGLRISLVGQALCGRPSHLLDVLRHHDLRLQEGKALHSSPTEITH